MGRESDENEILDGSERVSFYRLCGPVRLEKIPAKQYIDVHRQDRR
jgi:hypothetical protein